MRVEYRKEGELIKEKTLRKRDKLCQYAFHLRLARFMERHYSLIESGYSTSKKGDYFWIIKNAGDNCIKIFMEA